MASASSITAGQTVTLTATVTSATPAMPTGGVQFFDKATGAEIGVGNITNGQAIFTATLSSVTTVTIYAAYVGGGDFTSAQSADVSVQVLAPTVTSGFSMSLSAPTISLDMATVNYSQQDTITLKPISGYQATVTLSCSLPPGLAVSCAFPAGSTLNLAGQRLAATVKFEVLGTTGALLKPRGWVGGGSGFRWLWVLLGLLGALLAGWWLLPQRKHKLAWSMAVLGVALVACAQWPQPVTTPIEAHATITATGVAAPGSGYSNHTETSTVTLVLKTL